MQNLQEAALLHEKALKNVRNHNLSFLSFSNYIIEKENGEFREKKIH